MRKICGGRRVSIFGVCCCISAGCLTAFEQVVNEGTVDEALYIIKSGSAAVLDKKKREVALVLTQSPYPAINREMLPSRGTSAGEEGLINTR